MQVLFLSLLLAQTDFIDPLPPGTNLTQIKSEYLQAAEAAVKANRPLIVFSQVPQRKVSGLTTVYAEKNFGKAGIVVMVPNGRGWFDAKMYPASMSNDELRQAAGLEVADAIPFLNVALSSNAKQRNADGERQSQVWLSDEWQEYAKGIWSNRLELPQGIRFYRRSQWGQRIALTSGNYTIQPIHETEDAHFTNDAPALNPNRHVADWTAPGGLAGLNKNRWKSFVGISIPEGEQIKFWEGWTPVATAPGGQLRKKFWSYPVGTVIVDLLVNGSGEEFEGRKAEKLKDGTWRRTVEFKSYAARPVGFHGAGKKCSECHDVSSSDESQYFINLRRMDGTFSFSPMLPGSNEVDRNLPVRVLQ